MKIVLLLISFAVLASASYEKAKAFYDAKEYQKAIEEAKSSTDEYSNPKLHLIWAESAEALGHEKEAMSAYERVVMLDENDVDAKMKLVKIYNKSHRDNLAQEMKKDLQNYQLTPEQRNALALLTSESINDIKAKATLSIGYDSNINVSAKSKDVESTLFSRLNGSLSYVNELGKKGGWFARGDLYLYYQDNFDASRYNMFVSGVEAGIGYAGSNYTLYLPLGYERVYYFQTDMLGQISLSPKLNMTLNQDFILNINAKYASRTYQKNIYKGMNDSSYGGGAGLYYLFDKNFVYANFMYESFTSSETCHYSYIDRNLLSTSLGVNYNFKNMMVARVDYKYRHGSYSDANRADDYNQFGLKLSHYFKKNYELFVSEQYIKNSSNYAPADYSKNIAMLGISANY